MFDLNAREQAIFKKLSTPIAIQNFLDRLPINFEKKGETYYSPRLVLRHKKAHCMEGALFAAAALWSHGEEPLLLDLKTLDHDTDHVVALYRKNGLWGAISKTNHAVLRFRDPIFKTPRELALSYFHEYFMNDGEKTLRSYSATFTLKRFGSEWITSEENLREIAEAIDFSRHYPLVPKMNLKFIRSADKMERARGNIAEWSKKNPRT